VQALDGIYLDVRPGQVVALLGRSGAGKSTLLRVLGTTVLPDAGDVHVAGHDVVSAAREVRRHTGLVLGEARSWYWRLSGRANLEFFGVLVGCGGTPPAPCSVVHACCCWTSPPAPWTPPSLGAARSAAHGHRTAQPGSHSGVGSPDLDRR